MAVFSAILGAVGASAAAASTVGSVVSAVGTAVGVAGSFQQAAGQRKAQNAQKRAEFAREKQMELDSRRKQLELIRQQQIARATAVANITSSGAGGEGASALGGAEGTISGQFGRGIQGEQTNTAFGRTLFQANRDVATGNAMAAQGGTVQNLGQGLTSLGGAFIKNAEAIGRVGGKN